jgi:hypothetical protein
MKKRPRLKRSKFDMNEPIVMVWRLGCGGLLKPWRFAIFFHKRWFVFSNLELGSKGHATRIARYALAEMQEKAKFKLL